MSRSVLVTPLATAVFACFTSAACGLGEEGTLLHVFATHHAAPVEGAIPNRGDDDQPRIFDNGEGWTITLVDAFIVTAGATLLGCDGGVHELEMFWGPYPEDLRSEDLAAYTVAGRELSPGGYCALGVHYAPYSPDQSDLAATDEIDGATVFLRGVARRDEEQIEFTHRTAREVAVEIDLADTGQPLVVGDEEPFPKELTVAKTYDELFSGLDFATYDPAAFDDELVERLEAVTHAYEGTAEPAEG